MTGELHPHDFRAFFQQVHGYEPFPWQERLCALVCTGDWPDVLGLPTACGKTACLDIAVFAMATKGCGPRRVFFVVDRRVVVDAAYERGRHLAAKLADAKGGVLRVVAERLREMAQNDSPLDVYQMRGGIYRDEAWVRSPLQPMLIASTVDQTGSRLLFRGYGVGEHTLPIHASLVANDALILLDEAHCSLPFSDTLRSVQEYRKWAGSDLGMPFAFVEMTATPGRESARPFQLEDDDYRHPTLRRRLFAPKPTKLVASKARSKDFGRLASDLVREAVGLAESPGLRRIAVMVNRVKTARLAYQTLKAEGRCVHLLMGRMRPVDRSPLPTDLEAMLSGKARADGEPIFVVATQCLEVGADLDFDAVVTECASIDALIQRFGRMDRIGDLRDRNVTAQGRLLIAAPMADEKYVDPIYDRALSKTWAWLKSESGEVDFGICSENGASTVRERLTAEGDAATGMRREALHAPVLLPAHLDMLVQTAPRPALEPDIHLYLHGVADKGSPEVQVVWRADLDGAPARQWGEIVALCPPISAEAMPVPLREFRDWLEGADDESSGSSDVEGADPRTDAPEPAGELRVLRWRGDESELVSGRDVGPGDTLVLPAAMEGWNRLGHKPDDAYPDSAERARWLVRRRGWVLRLHPRLIEGDGHEQKGWPDNDAKPGLLASVKDRAADAGTLVESLRAYRELLSNDAPAWLVETLKVPPRVELEEYPGDSHQGWVLSEQIVEADSGMDESSDGTAIGLDEHLRHVTQKLEPIAAALIRDDGLRASLSRAAQLHDCGKADPRFQALLRGGDTLAAQFAPKLLAKGSTGKQSPAARVARLRQSGLPKGFRHELASFLLAAQDPATRNDELALHLIASHHGRCRPLAPIVEDAGPDLLFNGWHVGSLERIEWAAHRLDSRVADRFWNLTRSYGWWGLAYLESVLRLADWNASREEAQ